MLLGKTFEAFVEESPVSVMIQGILERTADAADLDPVPGLATRNAADHRASGQA